MPDTTIIKLTTPALTGLTTAAAKVFLMMLIKALLMVYNKTPLTRKIPCHFIS